ncbi:MAG TPA: hypothetical protein VK635_07885 [Bradyrhizobium sp.]|jgi:hypothetical protein|nr:hypothetical protein [Bradyrhizobium sp.]
MTAAKTMQAAVLDTHGAAFRVAFPVRAERMALAYPRELGPRDQLPQMSTIAGYISRLPGIMSAR